MGEYRFSVYAKWQFGLSISYEYRQLILRMPVITMHFSFSKDAKGVEIFQNYIF